MVESPSAPSANLTRPRLKFRVPDGVAGSLFFLPTHNLRTTASASTKTGSTALPARKGSTALTTALEGPKGTTQGKTRTTALAGTSRTTTLDGATRTTALEGTMGTTTLAGTMGSAAFTTALEGATAGTTGTTALEYTSTTGSTGTFASRTETTVATNTTLCAANALGHGSGPVDPGYVAAARLNVCPAIANVGASQWCSNPVASGSGLLPSSSRTTAVPGKRRGRRGSRKSSAQRKLQKKEEKRQEVRVMVADQGSDSLPPLLLPDYFQSEDNGPVETITRSQCLSTTLYSKLRAMDQSKRRFRKFVFGALYLRPLRARPYVVDPREGSVDIRVTHADGSTSIVHIRHTRDPSVLESIVRLGKRLPKNSAIRNNVGDKGSMVAVGVKNWGTENPEEYAVTKRLIPEFSGAAHHVSNYLRNVLPRVYNAIQDADKIKRGERKYEKMKCGPGSVLVISKNLGNASHYDYADDSVSFSVWAEEQPGGSRNWFFVMPSLSYQGSKGVLVQLSHGVAISWDGTKIRHCTSVTKMGENNNVYGCFFGSCNK
jgi:hypothetical protein